jgi:hypothetical protein
MLMTGRFGERKPGAEGRKRKKVPFRKRYPAMDDSYLEGKFSRAEKQGCLG